MTATFHGGTTTRIAMVIHTARYGAGLNVDSVDQTMPCGTILGVEIGGGTDARASSASGGAGSETRAEWSMSAVKRIESEAAVALPLPLPRLLHCR